MTLHRVLIGIGSNIEREYHTRQAYHVLNQHFHNVKVSSVYDCPAVGFEGPGFYNWVASVETSLNLEETYQLFKQIEAEFGRKNWHKTPCSRTMDLDLLCFDNQVCQSPVVLPRPEILARAFVLRPLAELVPEELHPVTGETYEAHWQQFDRTSQPIKPIAFEWSSTQA